MKRKKKKFKFSQDFLDALADALVIDEEEIKKIDQDMLKDMYALYILGVNEGVGASFDAIKSVKGLKMPNNGGYHYKKWFKNE